MKCYFYYRKGNIFSIDEVKKENYINYVKSETAKGWTEITRIKYNELKTYHLNFKHTIKTFAHLNDKITLMQMDTIGETANTGKALVLANKIKNDFVEFCKIIPEGAHELKEFAVTAAELKVLKAKGWRMPTDTGKTYSDLKFDIVDWDKMILTINGEPVKLASPETADELLSNYIYDYFTILIEGYEEELGIKRSLGLKRILKKQAHFADEPGGR